MGSSSVSGAMPWLNSGSGEEYDTHHVVLNVRLFSNYTMLRHYRNDWHDWLFRCRYYGLLRFLFMWPPAHTHRHTDTHTPSSVGLPIRQFFGLAPRSPVAAVRRRSNKAPRRRSRRFPFPHRPTDRPTDEEEASGWLRSAVRKFSAAAAINSAFAAFAVVSGEMCLLTLVVKNNVDTGRR